MLQTVLIHKELLQQGETPFSVTQMEMHVASKQKTLNPQPYTSERDGFTVIK